MCFMSKAAESFRKNLRAIMNANGLDQGHVAFVSRIARPHVSRALNDKSNPRLDTIEKLAHAVGVEAWEIIRSEAPQRDKSLTVTQAKIINLVRGLQDEHIAQMILAALEASALGDRVSLKPNNKDQKAR